MKYKTILADPPWSFKQWGGRWDRPQSKPDAHYSCMKTDEICNLQIDGERITKVINSNAHLYLWTTTRHLIEGDVIRVCVAWGFKPITILTWCKPQMSLGYYFRQATEHIIFGVKGKNIPTKQMNEKTWFIADRKGHSTKPELAFDIIERMSYPPRLELFGRCEREGWDVWGNQVEKGKQLRLF